LPSPLLRVRRIGAPYEALPLQDVCHALLVEKARAIEANSCARETTFTTKLVSLEQKRLMRAGHALTCIGDYRSESTQSELADELL
jgi:hypothetical protein